MARHLVTGATGFLGRAVAARLAARGHEVVALSRAGGAGVDVLDTNRVREAAAGCDGAFHCAGRVSRRPGDAADLYRVHVEGTKSVLEACARAGVRRVVVASTSGTVAVRETPGPAATEGAPAPVAVVARWPYYRAKLFAERAAFERQAPGFDVICVNPSLLLGPGDLRGSSTEDVRLFLEGAISFVPAGGIAFVDVRDAAEGMCLAMERGRAGERYLLSGCNLTVRELFSRLARLSGVRAPWLPAPPSRLAARLGAEWLERWAPRVGWASGVDPVSAEMGQCFWYADASKAERELGWSARDPNRTLYDTVEDLRARGVVWPRPEARRD